MRMSPESNGMSLFTIFRAVVLPPPDGPTSTQNAAAGISSESSFTAATSRPAYRFVTRSKTISAALLTAHVPDPGQADDAPGADERGRDHHREPVARDVEAVVGAGDGCADDR